MDAIREELRDINRRCDELSITGLVLSAADVGRIVGCTPKTARRWFRFGGESRRPVITRSQLARQLAELDRYRVE